jgi:hypothetical protein
MTTNTVLTKKQIVAGGGQFPNETKKTATKNPKNMSEPIEHKDPDTFQLAILAEILTIKTNDLEIWDAESAVRSALTFWQAADNAVLADRQLRDLSDGLFTFNADAWKERVKNYSEDNTYLKELLNGSRSGAPRYDVERDVLPELWKAHKEDSESRWNNLAALLAFAAEKGISMLGLMPRRSGRRPVRRRLPLGDPDFVDREAEPTMSAEQLLGRPLSMEQVRLLVETRQAQKSLSMKRSKKSKKDSSGRR